MTHYTNFVSPFLPALALTGDVEPGAKLYFYNTGTSVLASVYNSDGTSQSNPLTADINGRFDDVYLGNQDYRVVLKASDGSTIGDLDPYSNRDFLDYLAASNGSSFIGWIGAAGTAVARTVQHKLRDWLSVKDFGALSDGVTDNLTAFAAALAYAGGLSGGAVVLVPYGSYYISNTITVPDNVVLRGQGMVPQIPCKGTVLNFASSTTICIQVSHGSNGTAGIRDLTVNRQGGSPGVTTIGVLVNPGSNIVLDSVFSCNHGINYSWLAQNTSGISGFMNNCWSAMASTDHIKIDSWPELTILGGRYGINGTHDYSCQAYLHILGTDTSGSSGIGPNTLKCIGTQFNQGQNTASYFMYLDDVATPFGNAVDYSFTDTHVEGVGTCGVKSNATTPYFYRVVFGSGFIFNNPSVPFFQLNAATKLNEVEFLGAKIYCSATSITAYGGQGPLTFTGGEWGGSGAALLTITGDTTAAANLTIQGTYFNGGLTLAGKFDSLMVNTPTNMTNTSTVYNSNSMHRVHSWGGIRCNLLAGRTQEWAPGIGTAYTPSANGDMGFEVVSNTSVKLKLKGSDGTVRSTTLTLS